MQTLRKLVCASLAALSLLPLSLAPALATSVGQPVPRGTAPGQTLVWNGTSYVIGALLYAGAGQTNLSLPPGYTLGVGGAGDGSAGYFAPSGAGRNGVTVQMPVSSTGNAFQALFTNGPSLFAYQWDNSDVGLFLSGPSGVGATYNSGFITEVSNQIFSCGINFGQLRRSNAAAASGGMFRFDVRGGVSTFSLLRHPANDGGEYTDFRLDFNSGKVAIGAGGFNSNAQLTVTPDSPNQPGQIIHLNSAQSADAFGIDSTTNAGLYRIDKTGTPSLVGGVAPYTGNIPASALSTHYKGGTCIGYTDSTGTTVGN